MCGTFIYSVELRFALYCQKYWRNCETTVWNMFDRYIISLVEFLEERKEA
jgi:hypothetical protein